MNTAQQKYLDLLDYPIVVQQLDCTKMTAVVSEPKAPQKQIKASVIQANRPTVVPAPQKVAIQLSCVSSDNWLFIEYRANTNQKQQRDQLLFKIVQAVATDEKVTFFDNSFSFSRDKLTELYSYLKALLTLHGQNKKIVSLGLGTNKLLTTDPKRNQVLLGQWSPFHSDITAKKQQYFAIESTAKILQDDQYKRTLWSQLKDIKK